MIKIDAVTSLTHAATIQSQLIHFSYLRVSYGQKPAPQIKALL